ncbi:O-antigen ligase family protein [Blastococcus sp. HT6-30]|uniref:O-antigen ligase family protein n=1 Tax=Blastococcus sp. HT6-30 TaxID=3144843 RepID=UPI00321AD2F8
MIEVAWLAFLLGGAVVAAALFTAGVSNWPTLGLTSLLAPAVLAWEMPAPPPLFSVGGSNVFAYDLIAVAFGLVALQRRAVIAASLGRATIWLQGLALLLVISTLRGLVANDLGGAVNDVRSFAYLAVTFAWSMSLNWAKRASAGSVSSVGWARIAIVSMTTVALFHLMQYGLGDPNSRIDAVSGLEQTSRVLVSGQALLALLAAYIVYASTERYRCLFALMALVVVVLSQQRSVWLAAALGIALAFPYLHPHTRTTLGLTIAAGGSAIYAMYHDALAGVQSTLANTGTYEGRVQSWRGLLVESWHSGYVNVFLGSPMGTSYGRFEGPGRWVEYAPHNFYLSIYLRTGVLGFLLFLAALVIGFRLALSSRSWLLLSVLVTLTVYGWTYSWVWFAIPALALAWQAAAKSEGGTPPRDYPLNLDWGNSTASGQAKR